MVINRRTSFCSALRLLPHLVLLHGICLRWWWLCRFLERHLLVALAGHCRWRLPLLHLVPVHHLLHGGGQQRQRDLLERRFMVYPGQHRRHQPAHLRLVPHHHLLHGGGHRWQYTHLERHHLVYAREHRRYQPAHLRVMPHHHLLHGGGQQRQRDLLERCHVIKLDITVKRHGCARQSTGSLTEYPWLLRLELHAQHGYRKQLVAIYRHVHIDRKRHLLRRGVGQSIRFLDGDEQCGVCDVI